MNATKYLEIIGCDSHKPSRFQVNYTLYHNDKRYDIINGLVLSNWTVYQPKNDDGGIEDTTTPLHSMQRDVLELSEKQMVEYIFKNFIKEFRDNQITKLFDS